MDPRDADILLGLLVDKPLTSIAERLGVSVSAVSQRAIRGGLYAIEKRKRNCGRRSRDRGRYLAAVGGSGGPRRRTLGRAEGRTEDDRCDLTGFAAPLVLGLAAGATTPSLLLLTLLTGVTIAVLDRAAAGSDADDRDAALGALLFVLAAFVAVSLFGAEPVSSFRTEPILARGVHHLPFPLVAGASLERVLLVAGILTMLFATSNAIVRLVLTAMGTRFSNAEQRLRGGRRDRAARARTDLRPRARRRGHRGRPRDRRQGALRYPELNGLRGESGAAGPSARR